MKQGWEYNKYHMRARMVMRRHLKRRLKSTELVHHIDGNWKNNSIDNLTIMTLSKHSKHHQNERGFFSLMKNCDECGKLFKISNFKFKRRKKIFCDIECYKKYSKKNSNIPTKEVLEKLLIEHNNNKSAIGRDYGVSCSAVRKWVKKYSIQEIKRALKKVST